MTTFEDGEKCFLDNLAIMSVTEGNKCCFVTHESQMMAAAIFTFLSSEFLLRRYQKYKIIICT
jgi:hypothetical protein